MNLYTFNIYFATTTITFSFSNLALSVLFKQKYAAFICIQKTVDSKIHIEIKQTKLNKTKIRTLVIKTEPYIGLNLYVPTNINTVKREFSAIDSIIRFRCISFLPLFSCIPLHSSSLLIDKRANLFLAPSKTGKSTICKLNRQYETLSDDISIIGLIDSNWRYFSHCFYEKNKVKHLRKVLPINQIFFLKQYRETKINKIDPEQAYRLLLQNIYLFKTKNGLLDKKIIEICMTLCYDFVTKVNSYLLFNRMQKNNLSPIIQSIQS